MSVLTGPVSPHVHQYLDDAVLDRLAQQCGEPSGIGRMCLLDDATLAGIVRRMEVASGTSVLELGCGRGFLARWLDAEGCACEYVGIDAAPEALAAARWNAPHGAFLDDCPNGTPTGKRYDRIFAIESLRSEITAQAGAECIRTCLAQGGRFAVTVAEFGSSGGLLRCALAALGEATTVDDVTDLTPRVRDFATIHYSAMLLNPWDEMIRSHLVDGAAGALRDIQAGAFAYSLVMGTARTA